MYNGNHLSTRVYYTCTYLTNLAVEVSVIFRILSHLVHMLKN